MDIAALQPTITRRIEALPAGPPGTSILAIPQDADRQVIVTAADRRLLWVSRPHPSDPAPLLAAFAHLPLRPAQFVWIAAEAGVARGLRDAALAGGVPADWRRAVGYWVAGTANARSRTCKFARDA